MVVLLNFFFQLAMPCGSDMLDYTLSLTEVVVGSVESLVASEALILFNTSWFPATLVDTAFWDMGGS